jgi:hypothetical protein
VVSAIYNFIVGTWLLVVINLWILLKHYIVKQHKEVYKIDYSKNTSLNLFCGSIDINKIKVLAKENEVTLNTVLYTLMVKTWYYYKYKKGKSEAVLSGSPININPNPMEYNTNNMFVIFVETECHEEPYLTYIKGRSMFPLQINLLELVSLLFHKKLLIKCFMKSILPWILFIQISLDQK